ncbi:Hypothetical predicted protein [Pelobates cultripes]|uniref:Uncharacterized protein n=1 Tax=Pelobates cultripes TaxID=61616 RepID=A0AAD1RSK1_PELCU|nr:Hypothetical predicted protein [Pelobates cultripes]
MGKRTKKLKAHSDEGTRRIGDIFLARPKTKMVATPESVGLSSEEDPLNSPDAIPKADDPFSTIQVGDLGAPATKGDILGLLKHLHTWFRTDIALLREEVTAITDRVKATEEDISSIAQQQTGATGQIRQLQGSHQAFQARVDAMDDARRHTNIKVRGITETVNDGELPHFVRRLLSEILLPKQEKIVQKRRASDWPPEMRPSTGLPHVLILNRESPTSQGTADTLMFQRPPHSRSRRRRLLPHHDYAQRTTSTLNISL